MTVEAGTTLRRALSRVTFGRRVLLLLLLLLGDLVVVVLHLVEVRVGPVDPDWFPAGRLRLNRDRGLAESWGCVQTLAAAALLLVVHRRSGELLPLAWAGVLVVVVLDDGVFLYERLGNWAAATWDLPASAGLRPVDVGELGAGAVLGIPALGALLLAARGSSSEERRRSLPLLGAFLALVLSPSWWTWSTRASAATGAACWG